MSEFEKYHKIKLVGDRDNEGIFDDKEDDIYIEEKIDGGNFRFMLRDGNVIFGSRNNQLTSNSGDENNVYKNFRRCLDFVKEKTKDIKSLGVDNLIFYGECCVSHSLGYNWDKIPPYLGFDVKAFDGEEGSGRYISYEEKKNLFEQLDLPMVPLIKIVKAGTIKAYTDEDVPISVYAPEKYPEQQAEGVVFKNYKKGLMAKFVREKFREKNREIFGGNKKWETEDTGKIIAMYCKNPRIDKVIFNLLDEGKELDMALMMHLPKIVYADIWEENWIEISESKYKIDLHLMRKKVAKRCSAVLQQVIVNNALNG